MTVTELIQSDEVFASTLMLLAAERFGMDLFTDDGSIWTPETFRMEFETQFGCKIPDDNLGKLMAAFS